MIFGHNVKKCIKISYCIFDLELFVYLFCFTAHQFSGHLKPNQDIFIKTVLVWFGLVF